MTRTTDHVTVTQAYLKHARNHVCAPNYIKQSSDWSIPVVFFYMKLYILPNKSFRDM